jgi:glycosyltransferase involved in cell wall biosynthesis
MEKALYRTYGKPLNGVVVNTECAALIPCLNEAAGVGPLVKAASKYVSAVWVVDDGSCDRTAEVARAAGAVVRRNEVNLGKGAAIREGLAALRAAGFEWAIILDGDGQHDPADIPNFFANCENADLIIGNRMGAADEMSAVRRFVNSWMSKRISELARMELPDTQCGYRLIRLRAWQQLGLKENRFAIESEIAVAFARAGFRISFVPVKCLPARRASRIRPLMDTVRWIRWWLRASAENRTV